MYGLLIQGLRRDNLILHALKALRDMLGGPKFMPFPDSTQYLYHELLTDARVNESLDLNVSLLSLACDWGEGKCLARARPHHRLIDRV
ncbi:hypothetical protein SESBI_11699 [Sesbania bispinosa]|nr:hypothetical protein SESBI_11699 [Sesbania bispinosa]